MKETLAEKARRYLTEGRLTIEFVDGERILASCRGTDDVYEVGYRPGGWYCTCPSFTGCSHLTALQLVCVRPRIRVPS